MQAKSNAIGTNQVLLIHPLWEAIRKLTRKAFRRDRLEIALIVAATLAVNGVNLYALHRAVQFPAVTGL